MPDIAPEARAEIERRLHAIAKEEGIRILMAVESGSRAWGFPSPDSDYDARFIYVRPVRDYLRLTPVRDVVERPILDLFDVNGWDIDKTLGLLLNHNAVVAEWINSPIRYQPDDPVIARLAELADRHFNPRGYARHYASLGQNNVARWDGAAGTLSVKRYFYALRPALCVRALRMNPEARPPMALQELMAATDLPPRPRRPDWGAGRAKGRDQGGRSCHAVAGVGGVDNRRTCARGGSTRAARSGAFRGCGRGAVVRLARGVRHGPLPGP